MELWKDLHGRWPRTSPCSSSESLLRIAFTCSLDLPQGLGATELPSAIPPGDWGPPNAAIHHPTRWLRSPCTCRRRGPGPGSAPVPHWRRRPVPLQPLLFEIRGSCLQGWLLNQCQLIAGRQEDSFCHDYGNKGNCEDFSSMLNNSDILQDKQSSLTLQMLAHLANTIYWMFILLITDEPLVLLPPEFRNVSEEPGSWIHLGAKVLSLHFAGLKIIYHQKGKQWILQVAYLETHWCGLVHMRTLPLH